MKIHWYPGHMAKTRRVMLESMKHVDVVCEIVDARIPQISRNPDMDKIAQGKPRLMILNRIDLADPEATKKWAAYFKAQGMAVMMTDSKSGSGVNKFNEAVTAPMAEKIKAWHDKGQVGRSVKAMIVGIPNVGKSTFINKVLKRKAAIAADKPGVTRGKQWFSVGDGTELLDTPGILWPKLEDEKTGIYLAVTGAIKQDILDIETLACKLLEILNEKCPSAITKRYNISLECDEQESEFLGYELLCRAAKKRGFLISGGELDTERMARILLDEFRDGVLGKITLETPEEYQKPKNQDNKEDISSEIDEQPQEEDIDGKDAE